MPSLQKTVTKGRSFVKRGWTPLIKTIAHFIPHLQSYDVAIYHSLNMKLDLRYDMSYEYFFYGEQTYERGTLRLLEHILQKGDTFIDVGANLGYYSIIASSLVGDTGTIIGFEPLPAAFRVLKLNAKNYPNINVIAKAVGEYPGVQRFEVDGALSTLLVSHDSPKAIEVEVTTLDSSLQTLSHIDFIKIDVEGYEFDVIRGAQAIIAAHRPVFYFELLAMWSQRRSISFGNFVDLLEPLGYYLYWINHDLASDSMVLPKGQTSNYVVAVPMEKNSYLLRAYSTSCTRD